MWSNMGMMIVSRSTLVLLSLFSLATEASSFSTTSPPTVRPWKAVVSSGATRARQLTLPVVVSGGSLLSSSAVSGALALRGGSTVAFASYAGAGLGRDAACAAFGLVGATVWLKLWTMLAARGAVDPKLSRKIVHSGSAPLFMLTWPFFSDQPEARFVAALVPTAFMCRLLLARQGKQPELVKAISRSGDDREATGGPFLYVVVLIALTLGAWRDSLLAVVAISEMALGDGLADIVGRRFGARTGKWPALFTGGVQSSKSYAGSAAFAVGGFLGSLGLAAWFSRFGCLDLAGFATAPFARGAGVASWLNPAPQAGSLAAKLALLSLMVAAVELLPIGDDNLTVPAAACVLTAAFLGGGQAMGFALAALLAVVAVLDRRGGAGSASS
jgi:dolichol kinase